MEKLFEPVSVGGLKLRNRAVMPAMGTGYASPAGEVTPRLLAYLKRRAEGGVGLVITEVCAVHPLGKAFPGELGIYDDSFIPGLAELARLVKQSGAAVAAQLHHVGRETFPQLLGAQPVAPSPIPSRAVGVTPRALSREEIHELVGSYALAARRAREAGFDAVEVHGAHGYLVNQFLSPYSNRREDEYGGDPLGRVRFAREIVREIKREAGSNFPVIFRLSSSELVKGGYDLDYILPLLPLLEEDGVDAFHVSCGVYDSPGNPTCPGMHHPFGFNLDRAAEVKRVVEVPVIVVGKLHRPELADSAIAEGKADLVAFGRQHLADPHFLAKAAEGREEEIRYCLSCNQGCIERLTFQLRPITCVINPECGEEWRSFPREIKHEGPFLVVGAGPAGLQAALTLAEKGTRVKIVEREDEPGGQLRAASVPPDKYPLADFIRWITKRLKVLGAPVDLGQAVDEATIGGENWAGVILATGSRPSLPPIPGIDLPLVVEARELLLGKKDCGTRVLVLGAGPVGMETANYLLERECEVTVVEMQEQPPLLPLTSHGYHLHRRLREHGKLLLSTKVKEIRKGSAVLATREGEKEIEVDTVVLAAGAEPQDELLSIMRRWGFKTLTAGDINQPRSLLEATREGWEAALSMLFDS
jgi:2,4-dienoyl-CoA reductase-like NADH-dependent reductase (Old Yellow Enzyme family)/thioredoxin reductase